MPEAQPLALLRRNIDRKPENMRRVLTDAGLRKAIFGGISNDEKKAIKAFASQNAENALKTKPKVSQIAVIVPQSFTQPLLFRSPVMFLSAAARTLPRHE